MQDCSFPIFAESSRKAQPNFGSSPGAFESSGAGHCLSWPGSRGIAGAPGTATSAAPCAWFPKLLPSTAREMLLIFSLDVGVVSVSSVPGGVQIPQCTVPWPGWGFWILLLGLGGSWASQGCGEQPRAGGCSRENITGPKPPFYSPLSWKIKFRVIKEEIKWCF